MKRLIIAAGLILALGAADQALAQQKNTAKKTKTTVVKKTSTASHAAKSGNTKTIIHSGAEKTPLLNEKEYMWPDGQVATPTGHEASAVTGSNAAKPKDKVVANNVQRNSVEKPLLLPEREYMWKDGQTATPSGHEATPVGGGYAALKKDTVVRKPRIPE